MLLQRVGSPFDFEKMAAEKRRPVAPLNAARAPGCAYALCFNVADWCFRTDRHPEVTVCHGHEAFGFASLDLTCSWSQTWIGKGLQPMEMPAPAPPRHHDTCDGWVVLEDDRGVVTGKMMAMLCDHNAALTSRNRCQRVPVMHTVAYSARPADGRRAALCATHAALLTNHPDYGPTLRPLATPPLVTTTAAGDAGKRACVPPPAPAPSPQILAAYTCPWRVPQPVPGFAYDVAPLYPVRAIQAAGEHWADAVWDACVPRDADLLRRFQRSRVAWPTCPKTGMSLRASVDASLGPPLVRRLMLVCPACAGKSV